MNTNNTCSHDLFLCDLAEDITHTVTMTLKKEGNMKIEEMRAIIDNYVRDLQTRSVTDHQVSLSVLFDNFT